jgi:hypothetical protein
MMWTNLRMGMIWPSDCVCVLDTDTNISTIYMEHTVGMWHH